MYSKMKYVTYPMLILASAQGVCKEPSATANLNVSPKVCAVEQQSQRCELAVELNFELQNAADVCITYSGSPLKCWQNATKGNFSYTASVQFGAVYSLINRQTGVTLAQAKIDVQSVNIQTQRRRLRSPWSFF